MHLHPDKFQAKRVGLFGLSLALICSLSFRGIEAFATNTANTNTAHTSEANQIEQLLIEEAFERSKWMLRASHILIAVESGATENENRQAVEKISSIRESILQGTAFSRAARQFSDAPSVMEDDGDMGFFTVFEQYYPIETAAFSLQPGEISEPVKSRLGYHILILTERIPAPGRKRVSHLLIEDHSQNGYLTAERILGLAEKQDFEELVRKYSDDVITKNQGGDLGFDRLVNTLEEVRLRLKLNQVSRPVQTSRGWHILKVTAESKEASLTTEYESLRQKIKLDNRVSRILDAIKHKSLFYPVARILQ